MTPEEKRVVQAAIADHRGGCAPEACGGSRLDPCQLANAIEALQLAERDAQPDPVALDERGRHLELRLMLAARDFVTDNPPGLPEVLRDPALRLRSAVEELALWHGSDTHLLADIDQELSRYAQPAEVTTEQAERAQLAEQLREIGQGTLQEWMRLIDLVGMGGIPGMSQQARIGWQNNDGDCTVGWDRYSDDLGRFRITVSVQDLGSLPPVGPENDQALQVEIGPEEEIVWVPRTWRDVVAGDTVRAPGHPEAVTTVTRRLFSVQEDPAGSTWHVVPGQAGHWDDHIVQPGECWVILAASGDRPRKMDPAAPVEIALTPIEVSVIEQAMGGWENRVKVVLETS